MNIVRGILWGLIVAWIGIWIWLGASVTTDLVFSESWSIIFSLVGLVILVEGIGNVIHRSRIGLSTLGGWGIFWGLVFMALGIVIWFSNIDLLPGFGQLWPFIFVIIGLAIIINVIVRVARKPKNVNVIIDNLEGGKIDVDEAVNQIRMSKRRGRHYHE